MATSVQKMIIQSGIGFEEFFTSYDGEKLTLKISEMKIQKRTMTEEEKDDANEKIDTTTEMAKGLIEAGKAFFENKKKENGLNAIQGIGDILQGVVQLIYGSESADVVEKLKALETQMIQLETTMNNNFEEMKAFITEFKFFVKIVSPASVLMRCTRDCFKHPGPEATQNFRKAYNKFPPLKLAYNLCSYLEQKSSNPLMMSMAAPGKTLMREDFEKWENIFKQILGQFWFLEAFASGTCSTKSRYRCDALDHKSKLVFEKINKWKEEYGEKNEQYWNEMVTWFDKEFMPNNYESSNEDKAKAIKEKLETYLTNDQFYICVFNDSEVHKSHSLHCNNWSSQICAAWNRDGCNVFIYRSRQAYKLEEFEFNNTKREVSACQYDTLFSSGLLNETIKENLLDARRVRPDGLVCLIDMKTKPHVEFVNSRAGREKGPGYFVDAVIGSRQNKQTKLNHLLLVGLP